MLAVSDTLKSPGKISFTSSEKKAAAETLAPVAFFN